MLDIQIDLYSSEINFRFSNQHINTELNMLFQDNTPIPPLDESITESVSLFRSPNINSEAFNQLFSRIAAKIENVREFQLTVNQTDDEYESNIILNQTAVSVYSSFIQAFAKKITSIVINFGEDRNFYGLKFVFANLLYFKRLEHLSFCVVERFADIETVNFMQLFLPFLRKLPNPQLLKTLILNCSNIDSRLSDTLEFSSLMNQLTSLESFYMRSNYASIMLQDAICSSLRTTKKLTNVYLDFKSCLPNSFEQIASILENKNIKRFGFELDDTDPYAHPDRFYSRGLTHYKTDLEFKNFAKLVQEHRNLNTLVCDIDLCSFRYFIPADEADNYANWAHVQDNLNLVAVNGKNNQDYPLILDRINDNIQPIFNNRGLLKLECNFIRKNISNHLISRNLHIKQEISNKLLSFNQIAPSSLVSELIRVDHLLWCFFIYYQNTEKNNILQNINVLKAKLRYIENQIGSQAGQTPENLEKLASIQLNINHHDRARSRITKLIYGYFQSLLCALPQEINANIVDYLDVKSSMQLHIAVGGFFTKQTNNQINIESNINHSL